MQRRSKQAMIGLLGLASMMANSKKSGNRNHQCGYCSTSEVSNQELKNMVHQCAMNVDVDFIDELIVENPSDDEAFIQHIGAMGSRSLSPKLQRAKDIGVISAQELQGFNDVKKHIDSTKPDLSSHFVSLFEVMEPYQIRLLIDMNFINPDKKYEAADRLLSTVKMIGRAATINRFMRRSAIVVPQSIAKSPLFMSKEGWLFDWACNHKGDLNQAKREVEQGLNHLGLDFNDAAVTFAKDRVKKTYTGRKLTHSESLQQLAKYAWYLEVAKMCNIKSKDDLFFTHPIRNVSAERKLNIGESVFDQLDIRLHLPRRSSSSSSLVPDTNSSWAKEVVEDVSEHYSFNDKLDQPYLYYYKDGSPVIIVYYSYTSASGTIFRAPLFTHTTKMNAISFSLPAGHPLYGGSCISSNYSNPLDMDRLDICRNCYALAGHYNYMSTILTSSPRMNWVLDMIKDDPSGNTLGLLMSMAIETYARYGASKERKELEFGYIKDKQLVFPVGRGTNIRTFNPVKLKPDLSYFNSTEQTQIKKSIGATTQRWMPLNKIASDNQVCGYFRIHDSGDFNISSQTDINIAYISAWSTVATTFPHVIFWAPTRAWTLGYTNPTLSDDLVDDALKKIVSQSDRTALKFNQDIRDAERLWLPYVAAFSAACEDSNFVIRPSGLAVINPFNSKFLKVPMVEGLSAGTGANAIFHKMKSSGNPKFTEHAFDLIGFNRVFPISDENRSKRRELKSSINSYLADLFKAQYGGSLPKYSYTKVESTSGATVYQCPVNAKTSSKGQNISNGDSCLSVNCRMCWLSPKTPVTYGAH